VTIRTADGKEFTRQLDYPKGDPRNPLSDKEVEEKFAALAEGVLSPAQQRRVIEGVWSLEKQASVSDLMQMLKADSVAVPAS
jgi:2-methylcitrate dehydratase